MAIIIADAALHDHYMVYVNEAFSRLTGYERHLHDRRLHTPPYREDGSRRIVLNGKMVEMPRVAATLLGLLLHEVATNALKYGAFSATSGTARIAGRRKGDVLELPGSKMVGPRRRAREDGHGIADHRGVLDTSRGELTCDRSRNGIVAAATLPIGLR
ncbi:hypothetical protein [uncultured Jannaschia sp.]|uniref:hypothetical protein n=1 Tax=uncultured Jannaschia sp. TaxID=293347 RepID=UPI0026240509|nr:hypothetical protein [uncultured Jannaschia sp.]